KTIAYLLVRRQRWLRHIVGDQPTWQFEGRGLRAVCGDRALYVPSDGAQTFEKHGREMRCKDAVMRVYRPMLSSNIDRQLCRRAPNVVIVGELCRTMLVVRSLVQTVGGGVVNVRQQYAGKFTFIILL
uniref:Uncharacterized protein n=1 Tax=Parascaris equorum TaxID=6256 RepID=A0A914RBC9_PAREQ